MILVDVNLLLYAVDRTSAIHDAAKNWWERQLNETEVVGLPWAVLLGFVRLTTKAQVFQNPLTVDSALDIVDGWLERDNVTVPHPGHRHTALVRSLLTEFGTGGNLVADAHLAALAIEHRLELCSRDADFSRFPGLRWVNPIDV